MPEASFFLLIEMEEIGLAPAPAPEVPDDPAPESDPNVPKQDN